MPQFGFAPEATDRAAHCFDLISDEGETGVDCGGTCPGCLAGGSCLVNNDCAVSPCVANVCQDPSCTDGVKSGAETDTDCGGGACAPCAGGGACLAGSDCASGVCQHGLCSSPSCTDGVQNGAETDVDCGAGCPVCVSGQKCRLPTDCAGVACSERICSSSCLAGRGDCDANPANGCETNLKTDAAHCGACGTACDLPHATSDCNGGTCRISKCLAPFADCDGVASNGCETNTSTDAQNCAACGKACAALNGIASCTASACAIACAPGFSDCDGDAANGCEKKTDADVQNCGVCGKVCAAGNGTPWCNQGKCGVSTCPVGFGDCNADPSDGCEEDLSRDADNCKTCGTACVVANGQASCVDAQCKISSCDSRHSDCNGSYADGCESGNVSDPNNCGGCGRICGTANTTAVTCVANSCLPRCADGWGACSDTALGCSVRLDSAAHCGSCDNACSGSAPFCVSGACAAHRDIAVVNSDTSAASTSSGVSLDFAHQLANGTGNGRLVVVGVSGLGNGTAGQPASVQYAGVDMVSAQLVPSANQVFAGVYYLADAALPSAAGRYTVSVTAADANNTIALAANVVEFQNVEQVSGPVDSVGGSANMQACALRRVSDGINAGMEGEYVYSLVAAFGAVDQNPNTTGQTVTALLHAPNFDTVAGYAAIVGTGTRTVTWALGSCNAAAHALISLKPTVTP